MTEFEVSFKNLNKQLDRKEIEFDKMKSTITSKLKEVE